MHSKMKGALGQVAVAADLIRQGYFVFGELGDLSKIDLIAVGEDYNLHKLQVKAITSLDGTVELLTTKSGPNYRFRYQKHHVDVFAVYVLDRNQVLYVSAQELLQRGRSLTIRLDKTKNGQAKGVNSFEKYLDFEKALRDYTLDAPTDKAVGDDIVQTTTAFAGQ